MSKKTVQLPLILAIDTSCDDTSAAVTSGTTILSNVIASQTELHKPYGGVFPTVAKLAHKENIDKTVAVALKRAQKTWSEIDAIAVTVGPGLAPALEVGISRAKEWAEEYKKPLLPVNHIEGHVLSVLARPVSKTAVTQKNNSKNPELQFPALSVIVSGGHTQFVLIKKIGEYEILGATLDDAAGECLDKIGRMLNLGYPAGPVIEQFAKLGNPKAYAFPLPLTTVKTFDLSFSGLKTFARNLLEKETVEQPLSKQQICDFCASIQYAVFRHICYKLNKIFEEYSVREVWLGGGVAANTELRKMLRETINIAEKNKTKKSSSNFNKLTLKADTKTSEAKITFRSPYTKKLCMDNAAMIGVVGSYHFKNGNFATQLSEIQRLPKFSIILASS